MGNNSNRELLALKIEVATDDPLSYQDICVMVDNPLILRLIKSLRGGSLDPITKPISEAPEYELMLSLGSKSPYVRFVDVSYGLCRDFNYPVYYAPALAQAVVFGKVRWKQVYVIENKHLPQYFEKLPSIVVGPRATHDEVRNAFMEVKSLYEKRTSEFNLPKTSSYVRKNFDKYREWYWQRLEGLGYKAIADLWDEKKEDGTTTREVTQGVSRYKKAIQIKYKIPGDKLRPEK